MSIDELEGSDWQDQFLDEADTSDQFVDPLDNMSPRDQDLFFRMLDTIADPERRQQVMAYVMDHPRLIETMIAYAKRNRKLLENNDVDAMQQLLDQEKVVLEQIDAQELGVTDVASDAIDDDDNSNSLNEL
jgi:hypothetical protein